MRYVVLDTETTGLDPQQGHRVIEIGCVEIANRRVTQRHFHTYLNPDRDSDPGALEVHGLTTEFLSDKPRFEDKVDEFLDFIQDGHVIIHNAEFDIRFLNAELARLQRGNFRSRCLGVVDSLLHARELHPGKRNSLDSLCDRYGISNAHRVLHGALLDSELLAEVWLAMTRGQDSLMMDLDETSGMATASFGAFDPSVLALAALDEADRAAHAAYLAGLDKESKGQTLWRKWEPLPTAAE
ncbi:DNA polymerase III subunit epsilon [Pigmentiphaga humi]|uniref:DNA polymerase III subunit epsilon n=1 Tax=Pigmentiphaga humi TaxID=2478468 RepID=A0A3P4B7Q8_9BURK|nr:DNA polymerase III subunit epsilon [Pigmentiphaga humi]VCU71650.1 DNA polymerase III subunit epsilon [Pigmentiphaga humi]